MRHLDEGALQAWLDRDRSGLSALERDEIGLHLAGCTACRGRLEALEALSARAGDLLGPEGPQEETIPPYAQVVALARELEAAREKRSTRRSPWVAGGWAASVAVALGVGWMANALLRTGAVPDVRVEEARERAGEQAGERAVPEPETTAEGVPRPRDDRGPIVVSGRVTDPDGRPLAAAQVFVEGTRSGTLTNVDGRFQLQLDPGSADATSGDLTLTALLMGYATEHRPLRLDSGDVVADFELPQAAVALDQVVVTGTGSRGITSGPPEIVLAPGGDTRSWVEVTRAEAEERAGFGLLAVPGLRVLRIQVQEAAGVPLVRVVQELEGGGVLDLVEARGPLVFDPHAAGDGRTRDSIRRGAVTIAGAAPVDAEALRALLERVR